MVIFRSYVKLPEGISFGHKTWRFRFKVPQSSLQSSILNLPTLPRLGLFVLFIMGACHFGRNFQGAGVPAGYSEGLNGWTTGLVETINLMDHGWRQVAIATMAWIVDTSLGICAALLQNFIYLSILISHPAQPRPEVTAYRCTGKIPYKRDVFHGTIIYTWGDFPPCLMRVIQAAFFEQASFIYPLIVTHGNSHCWQEHHI